MTRYEFGILALILAGLPATASADERSSCEIAVACLDAIYDLAVAEEGKGAASKYGEDFRRAKRKAAGASEAECARAVASLNEYALTRGLSPPAVCDPEADAVEILASKPVVVRLRSATLTPSKADGRKWDGGGRAKTEVLNVTTAMITGAYPPAAIPMALARLIGGGLISASEPPDAYVKIFLNGRLVGTTRPVKNSLTPIWDSTKILLMNPVKDMLEFSVWDKDPLDAHDPVGTCAPSRGVNDDDMSTGTWIISCRNQVHELELSVRYVAEIGKHIAPAEARSGRRSSEEEGEPRRHERDDAAPAAPAIGSRPSPDRPAPPVPVGSAPPGYLEPAPRPAVDSRLAWRRDATRRLEGKVPAIRKCVGRPDWSGRFVVRLHVSRKGTINIVDLVSGTSGGRSCVERALVGVGLAPPPGGSLALELPVLVRSLSAPKDPFR